MHMARKTITVSEETFDALDAQRDGRTWDAFMVALLDDATTESERSVIEAEITDDQYTELYGAISRVPDIVEGRLR